MANRYVAIGYNSNNIAYSDDDGVSWGSTTDVDVNGLQVIVFNGSIYVGVGFSGKSSWSTDGLTWTANTVITGNPHLISLVWTGTTFVALGRNSSTSAAEAYTSTNGTTWTTHAIAAAGTESFYALAWNGTTLSAIGSSGATNSLSMTSSDGATWTVRTTGLPTGFVANDMCWTGQYFVAVNAAENNSVYSVDGINWQTSSFTTTRVYQSIDCDWSGTVIVVPAASTDKALRSTDHGVTWTEITLPNSDVKVEVCWNGTSFIITPASATGIAIKSANGGSTWTTATMPSTDNWNTLTSPRPQFVVTQLSADVTITPSLEINTNIGLPISANVTITPGVTLQQSISATVTGDIVITPTVNLLRGSTEFVNAELAITPSLTTSITISPPPPVDLSGYKAVQQATFVRMEITVDGAPVIVRMSTHDVPFEIREFDGENYVYPCVGSLLSVSGVDADLKAKQNDVSIVLSAIPNLYIDEIINNPIKGSPVEIRRAFFNAQTGEFLNIAGNPAVEFAGVVNNFNFSEDWDENGGQSVTTTVTLTCSSIMSVLANKVAGRRTNQADQTFWFPGDNAMNRVAVIAEESYYLGGTTPSSSATAATGITMTNTVNS